MPFHLQDSTLPCGLRQGSCLGSHAATNFGKVTVYFDKSICLRCCAEINRLSPTEPPAQLATRRAVHLRGAPLCNGRITVGRPAVGRESRKANSPLRIKACSRGTAIAKHCSREGRTAHRFLSLSARVPGSQEPPGPRADGPAFNGGAPRRDKSPGGRAHSPSHWPITVEMPDHELPAFAVPPLRRRLL